MLVSLLLSGCAKSVVGVDVDPPRTTQPGGRGTIAVRAGRAGVVVAAPHASSDLRTDDMATAIAHRTGFGLVVASGFSLPPDAAGLPGRRFQVNRPYDGIAGHGPSEERSTAEARAVYDEYERRVREAARGPLRLYVEIHGNHRRDAATRIEIATTGVDRTYAVQLKTLLELTRDAHLRTNREAPRLDVWIEPVDRLVFGATGAKRDGILRIPERTLHIELPKIAREEFGALYATILADFLAEAFVLRPLP